MLANKSKELVIRGDRQALPALYHEISTKIVSLSDKLIVQIATGIRKGLSPEDACKIAGIAPHQFEEWYGAGKALMEQRTHNALPDLLPLQPGEPKEEYNKRRENWMIECDRFVLIFKLCNQAEAELNEDLVTTIINYSRADQPDSWKAAREALRMRGANYGEKTHATVEHKHEFSGEVTHSHVDQVHTLIANLGAGAGTGVMLPMIVEGEAAKVESDDDESPREI